MGQAKNRAKVAADQRRAVLTIATGKPLYFELAKNLARSFALWHRQSDIEFILVTDSKERLPPDLAFVSLVPIDSGSLGEGFSPKLHLDRVSPAAQTLFVDADCLCTGSLESVFDAFAGCAVSVVGEMASRGEFFGDISERCSRFDVPEVPVFVGALYYFERGTVCERVFGMARALEQQYDAGKFKRLRGRPNEEPLISVAMAHHRQKPLRDDGRIKVDAMNCMSIDCDVAKGVARAKHRDFGACSPLIIHFNDSFAERPPYTTEALLLECSERWRIPLGLSRLIATVVIDLPYTVTNNAKNMLRPAYRRMFGTRPTRSSRV